MTRRSDQPLARPTDPSAADQQAADQQQVQRLRADARQNRARLITAATEAFADKGAEAPLEDIARRAGVGIGTLYRHFPNRLDLQAAVFRTQVQVVCEQGDELLATGDPAHAFADWAQALTGYLVTKRGLSRALIDAVGADSELISSCWTIMRDTTERLLTSAQQGGLIRSDVTAMDVMRLLHGVAVSSERDPDRIGLLLAVTLDGLAAKPGHG
jgi:AcrR family transcriptional regulator